MDSLPSLCCRVRFTHTTRKPFAKKWLTPLFGFAHPPPEKEK